MMQSTSQQLESYVPVYDTIPENWEKARQALIEYLKRISNTVNIREIGWFLEEELLSGKQFIPGITSSPINQEYRSVFRKTINTGALVAGVNPGINHGITFDANFSLIQIWVSGTLISTNAKTITGNDVNMTTTQIIITSPQAFDRSFCVIEYIKEL